MGDKRVLNVFLLINTASTFVVLAGLSNVEKLNEYDIILDEHWTR